MREQPTNPRQPKPGMYCYADGTISREICDDVAPIGVVAYNTDRGYFVIGLLEDILPWDAAFEDTLIIPDTRMINDIRGDITTKNLFDLANSQKVYVGPLEFLKENEISDAKGKITQMAFFNSPQEFRSIEKRREEINKALLAIDAPLLEGTYLTSKVKPKETCFVYTFGCSKAEETERSEEYKVRPAYFFSIE